MSSRIRLNNIPNLDSSPGKVYAYDYLDRVIKITYANGNSESYEYNILDKVTKYTDENKNVTQYQYNPDGTLWKVTYPDTGIVEYTYDKLGRKIAEKDQRGYTTKYSYNAFGNVRSIIDPYDYAIVNQYDLKGNLTVQKDKKNNASYLKYYENNKLKEKRTPLEYDNQAIIYAVEGYEYDGNGNMTKKTLTGTKDELSKRIIDYTYYDNDLLKTISDNGGAYTKHNYDFNGNLTSIEALRETGLQDISWFEYDNLDRKVKSIKLVEESAVYNASAFPNITALRESNYPGKIKLITGYEYDVLGNVTKVIDPRAYGYLSTDTANRDKYTTCYTYDKLNRLEKTIRKHNGSEVYKQNYYDANGNVNKVRNERGFFTDYTYDGVNRLKTVTDSLKKVLTYGYDKAGNQTTVTNHKNYTISYSYDKLNRLEITKDAYDKVISKKIYDPNGNVEKEIAAKGYLSANNDQDRYGTKYIYDLANRLVRVIDPEVAALNDNSKFTAKFEYNQYGEKTKSVDALGYETKHEYDASGRLVKIIDPLEVTTQYSYDKCGNKISMTDGRGKVTSYGYASHGILTSATDADKNITTFMYDMALNKANLIDRNGDETLFTYDLTNQLLTRKATGTGDSISYEYDAAGNRSKMTDASGTLVYAYDENNRLKSITKSGTAIVAYTYDDLGNIETIKDKKGYVTSYTYDKSSRMETVQFTSSGATRTITYFYDVNGNRDYINYQGGLKVEYLYDKNNRLKKLLNKNSAGNTISSYEYNYDLTGRQTSKLDSYGTTTYKYDAVGRIENIYAPGKTSIYTYDNGSNRETLNETYTSEQSSGYVDETSKSEIKYKIKSSQYIYSDANKLLMLVESMKDGTGKEVVRKTINYKYDNNGNQLQQTVDFIKSYTPVMEETFGIVVEGANTIGVVDNHTETVLNKYDGFNRLIKVEMIKCGAKTITEFVYNGDDLRVSKNVKRSTSNFNAEITNYFYDRQHVILETDAADSVKTRYIRGINYIARLDSASKLSYYMFNGHGDVVQTVSESGAVENSYDYDIWGNPTLTVEKYSSAIRYAGEFYDAETGLYYLRARYYDPYTGRFVSEDSYWGEDNNPLSLNLYTYCENDPIQYIDPSGHFTINAAKMLGGVVGKFVNNALGKAVEKAVEQQVAATVNKVKKEISLSKTLVSIVKVPVINKAISERVKTLEKIVKIIETPVKSNDTAKSNDTNKNSIINNTTPIEEKNAADVVVFQVLKYSNKAPLDGDPIKGLVLKLQERLNKLGYVGETGNGLLQDGWYHKNTEFAVGKFKELNSVKGDGRTVDQETWDKLFGGNAKRYVKPKVVTIDIDPVGYSSSTISSTSLAREYYRKTDPNSATMPKYEEKDKTVDFPYLKELTTKENLEKLSKASFRSAAVDPIEKAAIEMAREQLDDIISDYYLYEWPTAFKIEEFTWAAVYNNKYQEAVDKVSEVARFFNTIDLAATIKEAYEKSLEATGGEQTATLVGTIVYTAMDTAWSKEPGIDNLPDFLGINSALNKEVSIALQRSASIDKSYYKYLVSSDRFLWQEGPREKLIKEINLHISSYENKTEVRYDRLQDNEKFKKAVLSYWTKVKDMNENYDESYAKMKSTLKAIDKLNKN